MKDLSEKRNELHLDGPDVYIACSDEAAMLISSPFNKEIMEIINEAYFLGRQSKHNEIKRELHSLRRLMHE